MNLLTVHLWAGYAVVALALFAVWQLPGRRVTLYVVTLQILLGLVLIVRGFKAPSYHYALALVGWIGYMAANGVARRSGGSRNVMILSAVATVLLLAAFSVGMHAVRTPAP